MAAEGCSLHLAARSGKELEQLQKDIREQDRVQVDLHPGDLSTTQSMIALANAVGEVDRLIKNAGQRPARAIESVADAEWRRGFDLKLFGNINLTRKIYP